WLDLITFGLGLVQSSIFFDLGMSLPFIFLLLSIVDLVFAVLYYIRYKEPLFSGAFIVSLITIIYLQQWIIPLDVVLYTSIILITTSLLFFITLKMKDYIPFIGAMILLPIMFLSPYILSKTFFLPIAILFLMFPFLEYYISNKISQDASRFNKNLIILSNLSSFLGIIPIGFAVFYTYISGEIFLVMLIFMISFLILLKLRYRETILCPLKDWSLISILIFFIAFFDTIGLNLLILTGLAGIQVFFASFIFFEYVKTQKEKIIQISEFLLLATITIISITKIDFIPKSSLIILPLLVLLISLYRGIRFDHSSIRLFVLGFSVLFIFNFFQQPIFDWVLMPVFLLIAIEGTLCIKKFHETREEPNFDQDISIFAVILEIDLLMLMLGTTTKTEMMYPAIMLVIIAAIITGVQFWKPLSEKFVWVNSTFIITFGLMTLWNEYDPNFTLVLSIATMLPLALEGVSFKTLDRQTNIENLMKSHNFNITLTAAGLTLIILFEELNPFIHSLLLLLGPLFWIIVSSQNKIDNTINTLVTLISPSFIFVFELIFHEALFTPITEEFYLYTTLLTISIPAFILQGQKMLRKEEFTSIKITPIVILSSCFGIILTYSTWVYELELEVVSVLYIIFLILLVISSFIITWEYESILLLVISFLPSILFPHDLDFPQFVTYILPIIPFCFNLGIALRRMKSSLVVKVQESLMVIYLIFFIIFYPLEILEYTVLLAAFLLISWQIIGLFNKRLDQSLLELINFLNTFLVLILLIFIDSYLPETTIIIGPYLLHLKSIFLLITGVIIALSIILTVLSLQVKSEEIKLPILLNGVFVAIFSSFMLFLVSLTIRFTELPFATIEFGLLIVASILFIISFFTSIKPLRIKPQILTGIFLSASLWLLITSFYFQNIEIIFLWLTFAPMSLALYAYKQEKSYLGVGITLYLISGIQLLESILISLQTGVTNWLAILGLIFLGVELVSIGFYTIFEKKSKTSI
ncbi:MAG: hypothetical protein ACTSR2_06140, partial [Candidatus Hodarchaeales archaeon]